MNVELYKMDFVNALMNIKDDHPDIGEVVESYSQILNGLYQGNLSELPLPKRFYRGEYISAINKLSAADYDADALKAVRMYVEEMEALLGDTFA